MAEQMGSTLQGLRHRPLVGTGNGLSVPGSAQGLLDGTAITAVHAAGTDVWMLAGGRTLLRAGATGAVETVAHVEGAARATCVTCHGGEVWVAGDRASLWRLAGDRLDAVASFREAPTSGEWHTPWGGPPSIFSMASHGDDLYVGVHVGGIIRTSDRGATWSPTVDLYVDVHQVAVDPAGDLWAATGTSGLAHSADRGDTWTFHADGLHGTYLLAVAATADGVLVGASSGHASRDGWLYRFDGTRFEPCQGLPGDLGGAVGPRQLAAADDDAVVALPNGDVYASTDAGRRWERIADRLHEVSEVALGPTAA